MSFLTSALVHEDDDETQTLLEVCDLFGLHPVVGERARLADPDSRVAPRVRRSRSSLRSEVHKKNGDGDEQYGDVTIPRCRSSRLKAVLYVLRRLRPIPPVLKKRLGFQSRSPALQKFDQSAIIRVIHKQRVQNTTFTGGLCNTSSHVTSRILFMLKYERYVKRAMSPRHHKATARRHRWTRFLYPFAASSTEGAEKHAEKTGRNSDETRNVLDHQTSGCSGLFEV